MGPRDSGGQDGGRRALDGKEAELNRSRVLYVVFQTHRSAIINRDPIQGVFCIYLDRDY
jgi:hypothetical protein